MKKGFTLIELLVVIAILAVLATAVVLVLNPAELIRQSRDATRISDLEAINTALGFYLADVDPSNISLAEASSDVCPATARCTFASSTSPLGGRTCVVPSAADLSTVGGAGWIDVNLGAITGGSPLSSLPIDPRNTAPHLFYSYACDSASTWYEINADMESIKYSSGSSNVEANDGGDNDNVYEVGNDPGLDL
ncbi:hypothetical protein CL629_01240 [bacterium]|nr:hypothetical protein [bacterium]|tara:strand:+ start:1568 stop:2146 length:579 start_codon:yes stop_codon:yes gene_type:complete